MKKLVLISFALILTFKTFAAEVSGIAVSSHVNEFSVVDSKYAREIFLGLPVKNTYAESYHTIGNKKYEVRKGKHPNCYVEKNEKKDIYQCQFNVTIETNRPKVEIDKELN